MKYLLNTEISWREYGAGSACTALSSVLLVNNSYNVFSTLNFCEFIAIINAMYLIILIISFNRPTAPVFGRYAVWVNSSNVHDPHQRPHVCARWVPSCTSTCQCGTATPAWSYPGSWAERRAGCLVFCVYILFNSNVICNQYSVLDWISVNLYK